MKIIRFAIWFSLALFLTCPAFAASSVPERLTIAPGTDPELLERAMSLMIARSSMPYPNNISPVMQKAFDYADNVADPVALEKSQKLFLECAGNGDRLAQFILGLRYFMNPGDSLDRQSAYYWMHKAADEGLPVAQFWLAYMCANGVGLDVSDDSAENWLKLAAKNGSKLAAEVLAGASVKDVLVKFLKDADYYNM